MGTVTQRRSVDRAMLAARKLLSDPSLSLKDTALEANVGRRTLTCAKIILESGTPEQIEAVERYQKGVFETAVELKEAMSSAQRHALASRRGHLPEVTKYKMRADANLWKQLRDSIISLAELPHPADVVAMIPTRSGRAETIHQYLEHATKWLEEFSNEWTKYEHSKPAQGHLANAGNGHAIAGTQHPKPTVE